MKWKAGLLAVFLGHITIREQLSSKDIDLLALASGHAISQGNYFTSPRWLCTAHHSPLLMATWPVMSYVQLWAGLQTQHPSALLISGGFCWGGEIIQEEDGGSAAGPRPPAAATEVAFSWSSFISLQPTLQAGVSGPPSHTISCGLSVHCSKVDGCNTVPVLITMHNVIIHLFLSFPLNCTFFNYLIFNLWRYKTLYVQVRTAVCSSLQKRAIASVSIGFFLQTVKIIWMNKSLA